MTTKEAYQEFLKSPFWLDLREKKLALNPRCERCASRQHLQCHHMIYRHRWEDTRIDDLMTLCVSCHRKHHEIDKPEKNHFSASVKKKRKGFKKWLRKLNHRKAWAGYRGERFF